MVEQIEKDVEESEKRILAKRLITSNLRHHSMINTMDGLMHQTSERYCRVKRMKAEVKPVANEILSRIVTSALKTDHSFPS